MSNESGDWQKTAKQNLKQEYNSKYKCIRQDDNVTDIDFWQSLFENVYLVQRVEVDFIEEFD